MFQRLKAISSISTGAVTLACLTGILAAGNEAAAFTLFTDRASWEAAVSDFMTETFNSFTEDTPVTEATSFSGFSLSSNEGSVASTSPIGISPLVDVPSFQFALGGGGIDGTPLLNIGGLNPARSIDLDFDTTVDAFGFDTVNYDFGSDRLEVLINGTDVAGLFPEGGQTGFIGVVGAGIDSVRLRVLSGDGATFNALDNVSISKVADVPEPASLLGILALGSVGVLSACKRQKK